MRRRDSFAVIGGAAVWTVAARGQRANPKHIGVLWHAASAAQEAAVLKPLVDGIAERGYVAGQNVAFEHRFPAEQPKRF